MAPSRTPAARSLSIVMASTSELSRSSPPFARSSEPSICVAMMAGHVLLKVLSSFVMDGINYSVGTSLLVAIPSFTLMIGISALEILVAGIQAYVFALLTSLYINDAEHLH